MAQIHSFEHAPCAAWTGGTTSELFIYPAGAKYAGRDFEFRISSATIETEESDFTALPDYNRLLAVLEGELETIHEGKYSKRLEALQTDSFHGSWKTTSKGMVRDFNVIYSSRYVLEFHLVSLEEKTTIVKNSDFLFLFVLNGHVLFEGNQLSKYDLIEMTESTTVLEKGSLFFQIELNKK